MPSESRQRAAVSGAYSGKAWKKKVQEMPDDQIIAIYNRLKRQNKI